MANRKIRKDRPKKFCVRCNKERPIDKFYSSNSKMFPDGKINICKDCIMDTVDVTDIGSVKKLLRTIDKPFLKDVWDKASDSNNPLGVYLRQVSSLPQYSSLTWDDSDDEISTSIYGNDIEINEELYKKWGRNFKPDEILEFENLYDQWVDSYDIKTPMHETFLKHAIISSVKATRAIARGDTKEADTYMKMFKDITSGGKLQPSQMSKADLSHGLDTFSQLVREVEKAVDIVEILPEYKAKPKDKVDFAIYCYINYVRDLLGQSPIEYKDVYKFYEDRKNEYAKNNPDSNAEDW